MSKRVDMKEKDWEPFLLYHDPYHDNWCVILEHPNDKDNFIISFKGEYNDIPGEELVEDGCPWCKFDSYKKSVDRIGLVKNDSGK